MKKIYLFLYAAFIMQSATAQWSITGNAGTNPAVNFLGTTDLQDFVIKTNNLERMRITLDGRVHFINQGNFNLFLGYQAGKLNTTGTGNSALGNQSLLLNTTGSRNTALGAAALYDNKTGNDNTSGGYFSMYVNTTGGYNTAFGSLSLNFNSSGSSNVAVGYSALYSNKSASYNTGVGLYAGTLNTTGKENTFIGNSAGRTNDTGSINTFLGSNAGYHNKVSNNTFIGGYAGFQNTTGYQNVFSGYTAGYNNTSGFDNLFMGYEAGYKNSRGYYNIALGYRALYANTEGHNNTALGNYALLTNTSGTDNTAIGNSSLFYNTSGYSNTATGNGALISNVDGKENTGIGNLAGYSNVSQPYNVCVGSYSGYLMTGGQNTFIGTSAGRDLVTGFYNTCVGTNAGYSGFSNASGSVTLIGSYTATINNSTNVTALGYQAKTTFSNSIRIGNSSVLSIGGFAGWSNISDGRYKKEIKENVPGLIFVNELKPVTYKLDVSSISKFLGENKPATGNAKEISQISEDQKAIEEKSRKEKEQVVYTGFIAQDVEAVAKKINYNFSGIDKPQNENSLYGLRYAEFVVPLVKAVQELSAMNDKKDTAIENLKFEIGNLKSQMEELKSMILSQSQNGLSKIPAPNTSLSLNNASLNQNIPNPFNNTTTIGYSLPQKFSSANIIITDREGRTIRRVNISSPGKGTITVNTDRLSSGAYQYSLIVDGKMIATKQMERLK